MFASVTVVTTLVIIGSFEGTSAGTQLFAHPQEHPSCNKAHCASIVSYCLIQEKCNCDPAKNCSCCAECAMCLGDYYRHCCDCVGMRKGSNYTAGLPTVTSTVAMLDQPAPDLFIALTEQPAPSLHFTVLQFPVIEELGAHRHGLIRAHKQPRHHASSSSTVELEGQDPHQTYWEDVQVVLRQNYDINITDTRALCTVAYFDQCFPLNECLMSCESMGASSFRWFHNGCCQCAGPTCLNYGNMYPKCRECMQ
ncbi:unnamed protein product [Clavelina lepadiformis]|uniref:Twisted gastrulation n=1 Tax=Clavelina lepadiformis TaxID=159417 RepID=A0ABP0F2S7_CLALP